MSFVDAYLKRPHLVSALLLLAAGLGIIGYNRLPFKLFPDTERPQVAVVTVLPGASATDVESDLTRPIERELSGLDQVRAVRSTSRDEVSAVTVEFRYSRDLSSAATDVANALEKVKSRFPPGTRAPILFQVSSATAPVMTLALRPEEGSHLDLSMVRQMAENQIRDRILQLPEVANVEVFGGHQPVVLVTPDRDALERYHLGVAELAAALAAPGDGGANRRRAHLHGPRWAGAIPGSASSIWLRLAARAATGSVSSPACSCSSRAVMRSITCCRSTPLAVAPSSTCCNSGNSLPPCGKDCSCAASSCASSATAVPPSGAASSAVRAWSRTGPKPPGNALSCCLPDELTASPGVVPVLSEGVCTATKDVFIPKLLHRFDLPTGDRAMGVPVLQLLPGEPEKPRLQALF